VLAFLVRRLALGLCVLTAVSFVSFWFFARNFYIAGGTLLPVSPQRAWWTWFTGIPHGTLGTGVFGQDLWLQLVPALEHTGLLIGESLGLVVLGSLAIGIAGATRPRSALDVLLRLVSYATWSLPAFLVALLVQKAFRVAPGWPLHHVAVGLLVPAATLATSFIGLYARFVRSSLLVALAAPYTTTARAKGLPERLVVLRHALRNALATYVSILLLEFGSIFGAAMAVDWVFNLGGIGSLFLHTIGGQSIDPSAVQLIVVVTAAIVLTASLLADLAVVWLDPRVHAR
jgi:peptide/nickel transport system permease protein